MECSHGVVMRAEVTHGSPNFSVCSALIFFQVLCVGARGFLVLLLDDAECLVWSPRMSDYCPVLHSCVVLFFRCLWSVGMFGGADVVMDFVGFLLLVRC